jgi:hypothetical protein
MGGPKSAAVPHPDGTTRILYCLECPESWFEDFGKGQLARGKAQIAFDPDFAAIVTRQAEPMTPNNSPSLNAPDGLLFASWR